MRVWRASSPSRRKQTIASCAPAHDLPARPLAQQRLGVLGQRDPAADRLAERRQPEDADRQPQLQRPRPARELHGAVAEVDLAAQHVAQVGALERERPLEQVRLAHEQAADLVRLEQPLVRVEHQRVGALEAGEQRPARPATARPARRRRRPRAATGPPRRTGRRAGRAGRRRPCSSCRRSPRCRRAAAPPHGQPRWPPAAGRDRAGTPHRTRARARPRDRAPAAPAAPPRGSGRRSTRRPRRDPCAWRRARPGWRRSRRWSAPPGRPRAARRSRAASRAPRARPSRAPTRRSRNRRRR